jgi:hypothetical protein
MPLPERACLGIVTGPGGCTLDRPQQQKEPATMPRKIRPIRVEGNIARVPLTRGYEAIIDAADVPIVDGFNWRAMVEAHTVYAARSDYSGQKVRLILLHRLLMGEPDGFPIDHIDCDGLNNRRGNLRIVTVWQNTQNAKVRRDSTSGLKGVTWHRRDRKWHAKIQSHGRRHHLGYYDTPDEAHAAYCAASVKLHGEFGRTS